MANNATVCLRDGKSSLSARTGSELQRHLTPRGKPRLSIGITLQPETDRKKMRFMEFNSIFSPPGTDSPKPSPRTIARVASEEAIEAFLNRTSKDEEDEEDGEGKEEEPDFEMDENEEMQLKWELENYNANRKKAKKGSNKKKKAVAKVKVVDLPVETTAVDAEDGDGDVALEVDAVPPPEVEIPPPYQRRIPKCAKFVPVPPTISRCCAPKNIRDVLVFPFGGVNTARPWSNVNKLRGEIQQDPGLMSTN